MKKTLLFTLIALLLTGSAVGQEKTETQNIKALEKKGGLAYGAKPPNLCQSPAVR